MDNLCQFWTGYQMFWGLCVKTQCGLSVSFGWVTDVTFVSSESPGFSPQLKQSEANADTKRNFLCDYGSLRSSPIDHRWWKSPSCLQTSLCPESGTMCTEWYLISSELLKIGVLLLFKVIRLFHLMDDKTCKKILHYRRLPIYMYMSQSIIGLSWWCLQLVSN